MQESFLTNLGTSLSRERLRTIPVQTPALESRMLEYSTFCSGTGGLPAQGYRAADITVTLPSL